MCICDIKNIYLYKFKFILCWVEDNLKRGCLLFLNYLINFLGWIINKIWEFNYVVMGIISKYLFFEYV